MFELQGILGIIGAIWLPIIMITLIVWFRTNTERARNCLQADLYAKALEKGMELSPSLFVQEKKKKFNPLNTGIICIAAGLGVSLSFVTIGLLGNGGAVKVATIGIIPFFIGIAYLLIWFINRKQAAKQDVE